ncbi:glycine cleavage system protein GcvH [Salininema proteolyticum]|uniref:Glycine cleavage system H protein n=1 Tax=Salininema proteolyticum TaxID=1607685 RepID=A0ABV8TUZ2_9ACTN
MSEIPENLRYTKEHEWIEQRSEKVVRIGITDHAQDSLGDVVFVDLPEVGDEFDENDVVGEVESTKSVSDVYAPVKGSIAAVNEAVVADTETINKHPYTEGWLFEVELADDADLSELLDAAAYAKLTE